MRNTHRMTDMLPSGDTTQHQFRELGELTAQPAVPANWQWHMRNFLKTRWRALGQRTALSLFGSVYQTVAFQPTLRGFAYRMDAARLYPEQQHRLRDLLRANIDVRTLVGAFGGWVTDYGILSTRLVTTAGVNFLCDAFQGLATISNMRYHGFGTGTTAEAIGQTALITELTTQYAVDNTRLTGTQTEGGSANVYRTVATLSPDSGGTIAVTEHGLFDNATVGAGTLWDRSVFTAVNLVAGSDSLQVTYDLTLSAGG